MAEEYWNHNTAFHRELVAAARGRRVLDVGCGDGLLLERMRPIAATLTGVDPDAHAVELATARLGGTATIVHGGVDDVRLTARGYDLVTAVAVLHHLPLAAGLARLAELVAPGGELRVVGVAREHSRTDYAVALVTLPIGRVAGRVLRERWPEVAVAEASETFAEVTATARRMLPGARIRRRLWYRYTLRWTRPPG